MKRERWKSVVEDRHLEALYAAHYETMLRTATLIVGSREVAEDVVHDAFVAISPRLGELDNPGGYLRVTVMNGCRSHLRRRRLVERLRRVRHEPTGLGASELDDVLERLPPRQRTAVVLRYYLSLTHGEIAEALECRPSTARSLVHRGVGQIRKELE